MEREIILYHKTKPQREMNDAVYSDAVIINLLAGRQTGKTHYMEFDAVEWAMNNPKNKNTGKSITVAFISLVGSANLKIMKAVEEWFDEYPEIKDFIFRKFDLHNGYIYFQNGAKIRFLSMDSGNTLRGGTYDRVYVDECAFMREKDFTDIIMPFVTRTGGKIITGSTPNGRNWWYKMWKKGRIKNSVEINSSISTKHTYLDLKDEDNFDEIERTVLALKGNMTQQSFKREFLCKFVTDSSVFSNTDECANSELVKIEPSILSNVFHSKLHSMNDRQREMSRKLRTDERYINEYNKVKDGVYMSVDVGVMFDYTVCMVMNSRFEVVDYIRFNKKEDGLSSSEFVKTIVDFYRKWDKFLRIGYFEVNNKELLYDELVDEHRCHKLYDFTTNASNKPKIINQLVKFFEDGKISIPNGEENEWLIGELDDFQGRKNRVTGNIQYSNDDPNIHDDGVMALAIVTECIVEERYGGVDLL